MIAGDGSDDAHEVSGVQHGAKKKALARMAAGLGIERTFDHDTRPERRTAPTRSKEERARAAGKRDGDGLG
jgi:hypothetical protein